MKRESRTKRFVFHHFLRMEGREFALGSESRFGDAARGVLITVWELSSDGNDLKVGE